MDSPKWIWNGQTRDDSYVSFRFTLHGAAPRVLLISAVSNYVLYINGRFVNSGQYPDFPWYKVEDVLDICCDEAENEVEILVWYYSRQNMSNYSAAPGLYFEVVRAGRTELVSDESVLCRTENRYENGRCKDITSQLGYGFHYDFTAKNGEYAPAVAVDGADKLFSRPVKKLNVLDFTPACEIKRVQNRVLYDLGREEVGYLAISARSPCVQTVTVSYGEHIADGWVRRKIGDRDFSVDITVPAGSFEFSNYLRRLGLRYLEISSDHPLDNVSVGVRPCPYPVNIIKKTFASPLRQRIYDTAVRTLHLCMHDHYEDCPWREQALYTMDSRNQMLCGYYAFREFEFPRANLLLMSKDDRSDGLTAICTPTSLDYVIPSFCLHYFIQCREYFEYSGDKTLVSAILPKLNSIMRAFVSRMEDGLVPSFEGDSYWNFYEWTEGLDGRPKGQTPRLEAALNCLCVLALDSLETLCAAAGSPFEFAGAAETIRAAVNKTFLIDGLYVDSRDTSRASELVNSLAVLCGAAAGGRAKEVAAALASGGLAACTLSMTCFKYDALLKTDPAYKNTVLRDIDAKYSAMLNAGATSFWETEDGEAAFRSAGSLCHGWCGLPVYYYSILED